MEQEIIPAQNIVFAVLADGSYIDNFRKPDGGGGCTPEKMMTFFQGIVRYIKECPEDELVPFSLTNVIFDSQIKMSTIDRLEKAKSERESK
jgi:hypothetical protein